MKQFFAWAIVDTRDQALIFDGRCPIYWRRYVAASACQHRNFLARPAKPYRVEKVTILPVHRG